MPHDKRGEELQVGDVVMVPCRVKAIHLTEDYCNVDLETHLTMPPLGSVQLMTLNSRQTIKPTATHSFADYGAPPASASRVPLDLKWLIEKWRAEFSRISRHHATMGTGWSACADELEAAWREVPHE